MGATIQMVCCVTRGEKEDDDEGDTPLVERGLGQTALQKPLFERAESFATTIPLQTNGHPSP
jgi:hypothetical protein